jgi:hypothetical protein
MTALKLSEVAVVETTFIPVPAVSMPDGVDIMEDSAALRTKDPSIAQWSCSGLIPVACAEGMASERPDCELEGVASSPEGTASFDPVGSAVQETTILPLISFEDEPGDKRLKLVDSERNETSRWLLIQKGTNIHRCSEIQAAYTTRREM